eukprot:8499942-Karenia_brevis.AAC.1
MLSAIAIPRQGGGTKPKPIRIHALPRATNNLANQLRASRARQAKVSSSNLEKLHVLQPLIGRGQCSHPRSTVPIH